MAGSLIVLLAASGLILYRLPGSLQEISSFFQLAVSKIYHKPADIKPAESILRGTIFDSNMRELAVSYRVYSLYVQPAGIDDPEVVSEAIATIIGKKKALILERLSSNQRVVEVSDDLDSAQAAAIADLKMEGLLCKESEARFYPGHTVASHVVGFTDKNIGLAGIESKYDTLLQAGEFRAAEVPQINADTSATLGVKAGDIILTLDLMLQKQVEEKLRSFLQEQGAPKGSAIVLEPATGKILVMASQPAFNPNYFWRASGYSRVNNVSRHYLDLDLIHQLLVPVVADSKFGADDQSALPVTVASHNKGVEKEDIVQFMEGIGAWKDVTLDLPSWSSAETGEEHSTKKDAEQLLSPIQLAVTLAALVNGGWRLDPFLFDSFYDHGTGQRFPFQEETLAREHVFSPAMGVKIRRALLHESKEEAESSYLFADELHRVTKTGNYNEHSIQQIVFGLLPRKAPKLLFLITTEYDSLYPYEKASKPGKKTLETIGRDMVSLLSSVTASDEKMQVPVKRNEDNFQQFLVTRRLDFTEDVSSNPEDTQYMPKITGLSLRKGLQRLSPFNLHVRVEGSGLIVAQHPAPGEPLNTVTECVLTLE